MTPVPDPAAALPRLASPARPLAEPAPRRSAPARLALALGLLSLAALGSGCAVQRVQPWERDLLAQPAMQFDALPVMTAVDEHIHFSKEAASGGRSFGGRGCGCN
ncbi:MAG: hypothetical protein RL722_2456 [Pseudomonadota bacterium]|jgi:hypothetical protein